MEINQVTVVVHGKITIATNQSMIIHKINYHFQLLITPLDEFINPHGYLDVQLSL